MPGERSRTKPYIVDTQGRIQLPNAVKQLLDVEDGDYVAYELDDGEVRLVKMRIEPDE